MAKRSPSTFTFVGRWLPWAFSGLMVERWLGMWQVEVLFAGECRPVRVKTVRVTRGRELLLVELPARGVGGHVLGVLLGWLPLGLLVPLARALAGRRLVTLYDGCPYRGLRIDGRWLLCVAEAKTLSRAGGAILPDLPVHAHRPLAAA